MKVLCVVGARPNFVKIAPLMAEFKKYKKIQPILVHTGQHYDFELSQSFFQSLEIPKPDYYLGVGSASHAVQTAQIMIEFEKIVLKENPKLVLVAGDVNSTIATALVASKLQIPVAHVESGLRSFDKRMPEEINRILTDNVSDFLFASCNEAVENLLKENFSSKKIFFVGDIMIDSLVSNMEKINSSKICASFGLKKNDFAVLTLHRPENVDNSEKLLKIFQIIEKVQKILPILFVVHPRTKKNLEFAGLYEKLSVLPNVKLCNPLGYIDFLKAVKDSRIVLTDSGGIQEETSFLKKPCLTLRENTERNITLKMGSNVLTGINEGKILKEVKKILAGKAKKVKKFKYWDGKTAQRIVKILAKKFHAEN